MIRDLSPFGRHRGFRYAVYETGRANANEGRLTLPTRPGVHACPDPQGPFDSMRYAAAAAALRRAGTNGNLSGRTSLFWGRARFPPTIQVRFIDYPSDRRLQRLDASEETAEVRATTQHVGKSVTIQYAQEGACCFVEYSGQTAGRSDDARTAIDQIEARLGMPDDLADRDRFRRAPELQTAVAAPYRGQEPRLT